MEAIGPILGAGGSLISGLMGGNAASEAASKQAEAARYAADLQFKAQELGLEALAPQRNAQTNFLMNIARVMGIPWAGSTDPSTGYTTDPFGAGPSLDPYTFHDPNEFLTAMTPYIQGIQPLVNRSIGVADALDPKMAQFARPLEGGLPQWYKEMGESFIPSPGYQFQKQEAINAGLMATPGAGSGARAARIAQLGSTGAKADYDNFMTRGVGAVGQDVQSALNLGRTELAALGQGAELMGTGANWLTQAMQMPYKLFNDYFRNLTTAAGLGSTAPTATANLIGSTMNTAGKYATQAGGAEASGIIGASNAERAGITGAISQLTTGPNAPFSSTNENNWLSSFSSSGSGGDYGGGGDSGLYGGVNYSSGPMLGYV